MATAYYGEEPKSTSAMDFTEKLCINLLFPDEVHPTIDLAIVNSGKGAKHACLPYPKDELEYLAGFKI